MTTRTAEHNIRRSLFAACLGLQFASIPAAVADTPQAPSSFAYVLQAEALGRTRAGAIEQLATCGRDWIVLDSYHTAGQPWERRDLERIRNGKDHRKVLAYLSIGEAEDYRPYWRREWAIKGKLTAVAPSWLAEQNPEWKGNYRVKYWNPGWQKIMVSAIDETMTRGFDGVYLDIVDGFETFERNGKEYIDNRINPETSQSFRRDMVEWVKTISARARLKNPSALVIPQNGSQLLAHEDFLSAISGIGLEDLFTNGDRPQSKAHTKEVIGHLKRSLDARKPVLVIEYPKREELRTLSKKLAVEQGMTWLITDRQLKTMGISGRTWSERSD